LEESYSIFKDIVSREPDNSRALLGLGGVCHRLADNKGAISSFRRILESRSGHQEALKNLAIVLAAEGNAEECRKTIDRLLAARRRDPECLAFAAGLRKNIGDDAQALDDIDQALELSRGNRLRLAEYNDLRAVIAGLPRPSKAKRKPAIAVCCAPGMDGFIHGLIRLLSPYAGISASVSANGDDHARAIRNSDVVWLEWGNQLTRFLLAQKELLKGKKVIVRIHSYEIYDNLVDSIDFGAATDIIFVSSFMKKLFLGKNLPSAVGRRLHVIHNGIDTRRFRFVPRTGSRTNFAFLAYISYKKDPMVMMQAFAFLARRYPGIRLHVAGMFQDRRYEIGMPSFLRKAGLAERVTFYGHIDNADQWLADKDYIISSSLNESQGVGILEAMSRGCRPLTYSFPGADDIYPPSQLWTTFDDLEDRFLNGPGPKEASDFVSRYYTRDREVGSWLKMILDQEQVVEEFDFSRH
jgi:glycosyltransferase involved in cell wall biosynthesis